MTLTPDHFDKQSAELLRSGRPVLAGISGGRDSMALLSLLSQMPGCHLIACHVNHGLRPEAEEEAQFVCRYAACLGTDAVAVALHADDVHLLPGNTAGQVMEQLLHLKFLHQIILRRQQFLQGHAVRVQTDVNAEDFSVALFTGVGTVIG